MPFFHFHKQRKEQSKNTEIPFLPSDIKIHPDAVPDYRNRLLWVISFFQILVDRFGIQNCVFEEVRPSSSAKNLFALRLDYHRVKSQSPDQIPVFDELLLFCDQHGNIVGHRKFNVSGEAVAGKSSTRLIVDGSISTALRGKGLGTLIDQMYLERAQEIANIYHRETEIVVSNGLAEEKKALLEKTTAKTEAQIASRLREIADEERRWMSLYGPGGKLGFNEYYTRTFSPRSSGNVIKTLELTPAQRQELRTSILNLSF